MGTSAQLMVQATKTGINYRFRLGMNSDGDEHNLSVLASEVMQAAKEMRCLTKFKESHLPTVKKVLQAVADKSDGWIFTTEESYPFVSYTAILNTTTGNVGYYKGECEEFIKTEKAA